MRNPVLQPPRWRPPDRRSGVTLIELFVVMAILLVIAIGTSQLLVSAWQSQQTIAGQNEVQKRSQSAADAVVDSLRGAAGLQSGESEWVTSVFTDGTTVTYYLQDRDLRRDRHNYLTGETRIGEVVCRDLGGLNFEYYRRMGNTWATAPSASLAESLRVSVTVSLGKDHVTQTSLVTFRNKT